MNTRLLNDRETAEVLGIGKSTLWRWAQKGIGPKPVRRNRCSNPTFCLRV